MTIEELQEKIKQIKSSKQREISDEDGLENYYAGDDAWEKFAKLCRNVETENTKELLALFNNDVKLVNVIEYRELHNSIYWTKSEIPALNNLRPIDCVNDEMLLKRLKECLLRMD